MIRRLAFLAALWLWLAAPVAQAQIITLLPVYSVGVGAPVNLAAGVASGPTTSVTATTSADAPPGNFIAGFLTVQGTDTYASATDTAGNTYTIGSKVCNASNNTCIYGFYSLVTTDLPGGGTITFTCVISASGSRVMVATFPGASAIDLYGAGASGSTNAPSISTGTLGKPGELVLAAYFAIGSATVTESAGFTYTGQQNATNFRVSYAQVVPTSSVTFAPSLSGSQFWVVNYMTFKP